MPTNPYNKYIKQYQTSNVTTATPEKLMLMLFDAAIQFLQKALTAIDEKNYKERSANVENARKIIREFMRTIDLENGNDVSKNLFRLYNTMAMKLMKANVTKNANLIDDVIEDLTNIRWGFQKAIEIKSGLVTVDEVMQEREKNEAMEAVKKENEDQTISRNLGLNNQVNESTSEADTNINAE